MFYGLFRKLVSRSDVLARGLSTSPRLISLNIVWPKSEAKVAEKPQHWPFPYFQLRSENLDDSFGELCHTLIPNPASPARLPLARDGPKEHWVADERTGRRCLAAQMLET